MIISDNTIDILKNFATINPNILLKPGRVIRTISPHKTMLAQAVVNDEIDGRAAIYDLPRFLATLSLLKNPEILFSDKYATISDGNKKLKYMFASEELITSAPDKDMKLPSAEISVELKNEDLQSVIRAASILKLPEIAFIAKDGELTVNAISMKTATTDSFGVTLLTDFPENIDCKMVFKTEHMRLLPYDYSVEISSKGLAHFRSPDVEYWIAVEQNESSYSVG